MRISKITIPTWFFGKVSNLTELAILSLAIYFHNIKDEFFLDIDFLCQFTERRRSQVYTAISYLINNEFLNKTKGGLYTLGTQTLQLIQNDSGEPEINSEKAGQNSDGAERNSDGSDADSDKSDKKSDSPDAKESLLDSIKEEKKEKKKEKGEKEEAPTIYNFSPEINQLLSEVFSGPWKKKNKLSIRENIRLLAKYDNDTAIEIILYTIRGNYNQFYMPNEEVKSAAAARANSRSNYASKEKSSGISDKYFLSQQPDDKVSTDFRTRVRRVWGNLNNLLNDNEKEVFFSNPAAFEFDENTGILIIHISQNVKEIMGEETIYTNMTLIPEVSKVQIVT